MTSIQIVIPCFNEASRFSALQASELLANDDISLVLVNDGSSDNTLNVLSRFAQDHVGRVNILNLEHNVGKAEAVRLGMLTALNDDSSVQVAGYLDADFATPAYEMLRLVDCFDASRDKKVLLGSRWLHLGADIQRKPLRHYGGRVFATFASQVLNLTVYDTQCGAKLFRAGDVLSDALQTGFVSSWAFDVELIGRLRQGYSESEFIEIPLNRWIDVAGSKISMLDMFRATIALFSIRRALSDRLAHSNALAVRQEKNSDVS